MRYNKLGFSFVKIFVKQQQDKKYDPNRSRVTTWLNRYLKWRLQDFRLANQAAKKNKVTKIRVNNSETIDIVDNLAANPDITSILLSRHLGVNCILSIKLHIGMRWVTARIKTYGFIMKIKIVPNPPYWR